LIGELHDNTNPATFSSKSDTIQGKPLRRSMMLELKIENISRQAEEALQKL